MAALSAQILGVDVAYWHMPVERMCRPNVRFREAANIA